MDAGICCELAKGNDGMIKLCLVKICSGSLTSDLQRPDISRMRNTLYDAFVQFPDDIGLFIKYPFYLRSIPYERLIDEPTWKTAEPSKTAFIESICSIQPLLI